MKITDLRKTVGSFELTVPELTLEEGKIHGIVGPNGCGKTVLLKILMGIIEPDEGRIDYEGLGMKDITMMSQRPYMLKRSVYQNLIYPLTIRGIKPDEEEIDRLLDRIGMKDRKDQYSGSLSSGERQKVSFMRAMIFHPRMIMMDETLANLDADSARIFNAMIRERQEKENTTWIIVSHQWDQYNDLFDEVHFMEKGRVVR